MVTENPDSLIDAMKMQILSHKPSEIVLDNVIKQKIREILQKEETSRLSALLLSSYPHREQEGGHFPRGR